MLWAVRGVLGQTEQLPDTDLNRTPQPDMLLELIEIAVHAILEQGIEPLSRSGIFLLLPN